MKRDRSKPQATANDNDTPSGNAISFTDLCAAMGQDEDAVLQRLAVILSRREEADDGK